MKAEEIAALNLRKGDKVRLSLPSSTVEGTVDRLGDHTLTIVGRYGTSLVKFGQIQGVLKYAEG